MVNKVDAADEETLLRLKRTWPDAVFVSARSGPGIDELRAAIEAQLPRPAVELRVVVPYDRGDLVARIHRTGQVLEHRAHRGRHRAAGAGGPSSWRPNWRRSSRHRSDDHERRDGTRPARRATLAGCGALFVSVLLGLSGLVP